MKSTLSSIEMMLLGGGNISLSRMIKHFGADSYLVMIFLLIAPNLIPFFSQFGIAEFTSGMVCLLSLQLMIGREIPWLPKKMANRELSCEKASSIGNKIFPMMYKLDLWTQPRLSILASERMYKFYGLMIFILSALILLPLPFFNYAPAVVIMLSVIGMLSSDGLFILLALISFVAIIGAFIYAANGLIA